MQQKQKMQIIKKMRRHLQKSQRFIRIPELNELKKCHQYLLYLLTNKALDKKMLGNTNLAREKKMQQELKIKLN